jgi:hypothetical protein
METMTAPEHIIVIFRFVIFAVAGEFFPYLQIASGLLIAAMIARFPRPATTARNNLPFLLLAPPALWVSLCLLDHVIAFYVSPLGGPLRKNSPTFPEIVITMFPELVIIALIALVGFCAIFEACRHRAAGGRTFVFCWLIINFELTAFSAIAAVFAMFAAHGK